MWTIIYRFEVKPGKKEDFQQAWRDLTGLIYKHAGSLGSCLHRDRSGHYLAYARWPDSRTWDEAPDKLPAEASTARNAMRVACLNIETLYEMEVTDDLLQEDVFFK